MNRALFSVVLPALAAAFLLASAGADARGFFFQDPDPGSPGLTPEEAALAFLADNPQYFYAASTDELAWVKTHTRKNVSYVRFRQVHLGYGVEDAEVILTVDEAGRVYQVSDSTVDPAFLPDSASCISGEEARIAVESMLPGAVVRETRGPVYSFVMKGGGGAAFVRAVRVKMNDPFDLWDLYIDCSNAGLAGFKHLVWNAEGYAYIPNPAVNPEYQTVTLENLEDPYDRLHGSLASAWACSNSACDEFVQRAEADEDGNFFYEPDEPSLEDAFSEVHGYYHTNLINDWFDTELGLALRCGSSRTMYIVTNMDYPNAFYGDVNGDRCGDIAFGQDMDGPGIDFSYDADVIYHEFTHGVVDETAGLRGMAADELGWDFSSGGLNEGTADYYSVSFTDNPNLGEYALGSYGGELSERHADNENTCPNSLNGESHNDGETWLGTLWEIRESLGHAKTDQLVMSVLNAISRNADFDEAGKSLVTQAGVLEGSGTLDEGDADIVESIANARGLVDCERVVYLEDGDAGSSYMFGLQEMWGSIDKSVSGIQFAIVAPPGATRVVFQLLPISFYGTAPYKVYVNYDAPIGFDVVGDRPARPEPDPDRYDHIIDSFDGSDMSVAWTEWSDPPVEPGRTYHITFSSTSDYGMMMSVIATVVARDVPDTEPDAVTDAVEDPPEEMVEDVPFDSTDDTAGDAAPDQEQDAPVADATDDADPSDADDDISGEIVEKGCGCRVSR